MSFESPLNSILVESIDSGSCSAEHPSSANKPAQPASKLPFSKRLQGITGWLTKEPTPLRHLLRQSDPETDGETTFGWCPRGKVGMLAAAGGVGKTRAMIQLAIAVATGRPWFGLSVPEPGRVFLGLAEESAEDLQRALYYACRSQKLSAGEIRLAEQRILVAPLAGENASLLETDAKGNIQETTAMQDLWSVLHSSQEEWALIVLDPLARFQGLEENGNREAATTVAALETLVTLNGNPTVLVIHHTNKVGRRDREQLASAVRGGTALVDSVRWCALMMGEQKDDLDLVHLQVVKTNYTKAGQRITLVREPDSQGALRLLSRAEAEQQRVVQESAKARELEEKILQLLHEGTYTSRAQIRASLSANNSRISQAVARLLERNEIHRENGSPRGPFRVTHAS